MVDPILTGFSAAFKHIRTIRDTNQFLKALLTPQELDQIPKRLECLIRIGRGQNRRKIAKDLEVSTSTVAKISNILGSLEFENPLWWVNFKKRHGIFIKKNEDRRIGWNR